MFHVDDEFDFDDDLLDTPTTSNEVSKLEDGSNKCPQINEIVALQPSNNFEPEFLDGGLKLGCQDKGINFPNFWESKNENIPTTVNLPFSDKSELITKHVRKTVRQRRFPGPAGLLPERQGNTSLIATEEFLHELNSENDESSFKEKEVLSQRSERVFECGAWGAVMEDLGPSGRALISLMNLASLRLKHIRGYKVPFLAIIINNIDCTLPDPTLVVKDPTGEMHGMLHREVWEKFNAEMIPGSVLVLKNVGVISAGTISRRHVLNITENNLTAIYSIREEEHVQVRKISDLPTGDNSRMLAEWNSVVSSPVASEKSLTTTPTSLIKPQQTKINPFFTSPSPSTPKVRVSLTKPSFIRQQLKKDSQSVANFIGHSRSEHPLKKRKNRSVKGTDMAASLLPVQNNTFKIDCETSIVESLLDGVDTDSLFEEF